MEMIEKVEKALRDKYLATRYDGKEHWRDMAIAAINAMREPSSEMEDAGRDVGPDAPYGVYEVRERWQAMIDAALSETE